VFCLPAEEKVSFDSLPTQCIPDCKKFLLLWIKRHKYVHYFRYSASSVTVTWCHRWWREHMMLDHRWQCSYKRHHCTRQRSSPQPAGVNKEQLPRPQTATIPWMTACLFTAHQLVFVWGLGFCTVMNIWIVVFWVLTVWLFMWLLTFPRSLSATRYHNLNPQS
jgi:hypothetical protein